MFPAWRCVKVKSDEASERSDQNSGAVPGSLTTVDNRLRHLFRRTLPTMHLYESQRFFTLSDMLVSAIFSHDRIAAPASLLRDPRLRIGVSVLGIHVPGHQHCGRTHPAGADVWHSISDRRHGDACVLRAARARGAIQRRAVAAHGRDRNSASNGWEFDAVLCRAGGALG